MGRVAAIRLEERDRVSHEVVQAARVVQELTDGDALGERRRVAAELEQALLDQPQHEWRDEDLRHAPDAKAVLGRQGCAGLDVGDSDSRFDPAFRARGDDNRPGNAGFDHGSELILDFCHEVA